MRSRAFQSATQSLCLIAACGFFVSCDHEAGDRGAMTLPSGAQPRPLEDPSVFQNYVYPFRTDRIERVFAPGAGGEILLDMEESALVLYQWTSDGGRLYSDLHGHSSEGSGYWVQYRLEESGNSDYGSLAAPFAGEHGWYFRNDGEAEVVVSLRVSGYFSGIAH